MPQMYDAENVDQSDTEPARSGLPVRLIRLPEVMARVGLKRSAIYTRMSQGRFPKSRTLSAKCTVWIDAEIEEWIANIAAGHRG